MGDEIEIEVVQAADGFTSYLFSMPGFAFPMSADWAVYEPSVMYFIGMLETMDMSMMSALSEKAQTEKPVADDAEYKVYDGVAHMDFVGLMTKRPTCMSEMMGGGAYTTMLRRQLSIANRDPSVKSKLLRIESPGGEISGVFDAAHHIMQGKPTDIHAEDMCCSGGMALAAGGRTVTVNSSGVMGSVGVYTVLPDTSEADRRAGRTLHVVKAGRYKAIGAGGPITAEQLAATQERVDAQHAVFIRHIVKGRTSMTKDQLAEVADAKVYIGAAAVKAGLADRVATFDQAHKSAMQANKEGRTFSMAIKDEQLRAWVNDPAAAPAPAALPNPPALPDHGTQVDDDTQPPADPAVPAVPAQPVLVSAELSAALHTLGVSDVSNLRSLAADAAIGRTTMTEARDRAIRLAEVVFADNAADLASTVAYLGAAPLALVRMQTGMFEDNLRTRGLAAPEGMTFSPRYSSPPPNLPDPHSTAADATGTPPAKTIADMVKELRDADAAKTEARLRDKGVIS